MGDLAMPLVAERAEEMLRIVNYACEAKGITLKIERGWTEAA